jgi:predicted metal-binding membrane protein
MSISTGRWARATLHAVAAFFVATPISCYAFTWMVRNDQDGQAGMGAAIGAFYLGCIVAIVTFIISLRRSSPARQEEDSDR